MCGICGIVPLGNSNFDFKSIVDHMSDQMIHRGPDHYGHELFSHACLGMRRLSIIDLSSAGNQPMHNEDKSIWAVCNGEIYNYLEIREELKQKGHCLLSNSDVEVIVHLYEEFGEDCVHKLRGMFALAIWDDNKKQLFIARDRLGIKPLYHAISRDSFLFSSEIKAFHTINGFDKQIDYMALDNYLSFGYIPPPRTAFKNISALLPGHSITVKDGCCTMKKWWDFPQPQKKALSVVDTIQEMRTLLEESIRIHKISDVSIGAFLSGGIDSTAVVALMSQLSSRPIRTFSIGFGEEVASSFNELSLAKIVADRYQTDHTEVFIDGRDVANELETFIWHLDQPSFDGINTYFVSKAAKEGGLTVALSGLGGDELFGGYGSYDLITRLFTPVSMWGSLPGFIRKTIAGITSPFARGVLGNRRWNKFNKIPLVDSPIALYALARFNLWPEEKTEFYTSDFFDQLEPGNHVFNVLKKYAKNNGNGWDFVTSLELQTYMNWRLLRDTDVMSMAHSLEVRVPLIDHKLVEYVCRLPRGWHKILGYPKKLLTNSLSDCIPEQIVNAPKHGFEFPMAYWMKNELKEIVEDTLSEHSIKKRGYFSYQKIQKLYDLFKKDQVSYPVLWQFVVMELWMRQNYD